MMDDVTSKLDAMAALCYSLSGVESDAVDVRMLKRALYVVARDLEELTAAVEQSLMRKEGAA